MSEEMDKRTFTVVFEVVEKVQYEVDAENEDDAIAIAKKDVWLDYDNFDFYDVYEVK